MADNAVQTTLPPLAASPPLSAPPLPDPAPKARPNEVIRIGKKILSVLASLRLTVFLLVLSMVIVFTGTLAQVDLSTQEVMKTYFRGFYVWIPFQIFFHPKYHVWGGFPFPGGWTIGFCLLTNLLAAHMVRFKLSWKRSGVLLIHGGLIVMMLGELMTGLFATEGKMGMFKDQTVNYVEYPNSPELALTTRATKPGFDDVVVVPASMLTKDKTIRSPDLPVDVKVDRYYINAEVQGGEPSAEFANLRELAVDSIPIEKPEPNGTSTDTKFNAPAAYVTFLTKDTQEVLGTYLLWIYNPSQTLKVGDKTYEVALRYSRVYKPYQMTLLEARHDKFQGTDIPRNYSSKVRLVDKETGEKREVLIRMNEPLRYRGEAFYQENMSRGGIHTGLQVVNNPGWLMPYFSCAIVSLGLCVHFGMSLNTFLNRRAAS